MILKKWTRLFYLCILLGSLPVLAQEKPGATVWTRGSVESAKALFGPEANVRVLSAETERARERKDGFLPPRERDAVFRKVGIETKIQSMDDFEKDLLMMSAREYTIRELRSDYPMLNETQLKRLQREMKKIK